MSYPVLSRCNDVTFAVIAEVSFPPPLAIHSVPLPWVTHKKSCNLVALIKQLYTGGMGVTLTEGAIEVSINMNRTELLFFLE